MATKGRTKLFIENILIYGLGGMISKIIPLVMLPVIANLYPNTEYMGLNDLSTTFVLFASALAVCGMYDSMFRMFFDDKSIEWQRKVCSTAIIFVTIVSVFMGFICFMLKRQIAGLYFKDEKYVVLAMVTIVGFMVSSTNQIISAPTRIQNKRITYLIANTVSPVISYAVAIPMILKGHYIMAMPVATIIASASIEISFAIMNHSYFKISSFDTSVLKSLLKIGIPLMPNFIVYWIYNSSDKLMIASLIGTEFTGIYSVPSKIGHISNLIYTAFAGGWLYFAYSTMNDDDQVKMKSNIFEYMGALSFAATSAMIAGSKIIFLIFPKEYAMGYLTAPYLFLAPLMLMLYQIIANQFTIMKKTYMNLMTLSIGAAANVGLNLILIRKIGIEGAAIATVIGYIISITMCLLILRKMKLIIVNKKVYLNAGILLVFYAVWRIWLHESYVLSVAGGIIVCGLYAFIYRDMLLGILKKRKKKVNENDV